MKAFNAFHVMERGYSHLEDDKPLQDWAASSINDNRAIIVIADGHGSAPYFRSDRGAKFAVEAAQELLENIAENYVDMDEAAYAQVTELVQSALQKKWLEKVQADYANEPFTDAEFLAFRHAIEAKSDVKAQEHYKYQYYKCYKEGRRIDKAYGCTVIAVLMTRSYCLGIHVGDGKCVAVYNDASADQPIPWDEECVANIASSMCNSKFVCRVHLFERRPSAVFIASDGIDDTFGDGEGLYQFYRKICSNFVSNGDDYVQDLQESLPEITRIGSHDDLSIAGIYNLGEMEKCNDIIAQYIDLSTMYKKQSALNQSIANTEYSLNGAEKRLEIAKKELDKKEEAAKLSTISRIDLLHHIETLLANFNHSDNAAVERRQREYQGEIKNLQADIDAHDATIAMYQRKKAASEQQLKDIKVKMSNFEAAHSNYIDKSESLSREDELNKTLVSQESVARAAYNKASDELKNAKEQLESLNGDLAMIDKDIQDMLDNISKSQSKLTMHSVLDIATESMPLETSVASIPETMEESGGIVMPQAEEESTE